MKQHSIARVTSLVSLAGLILSVISASAQGVTGDLYLDNLAPANITAYPSWTSSGITMGSTGTTVSSAGGFGSLYYQLSTPLALDPGLNTATLVLTVNSPSAPPATSDWLGIPFQLGDNSGSVTYGGYAGMFGSGYAATASPGTATWNGNTVTETVTLGSAPTGGAAQLAAIQAGGDYLYGFNLELDPAVLAGGVSAYNVTFNSLTLSSVPEPSSLALFGIGVAAALVICRPRRNNSRAVVV